MCKYIHDYPFARLGTGNYNTKRTDAQGKLKLRSVITREEGELGFLIIPRAQPAG